MCLCACVGVCRYCLRELEAEREYEVRVSYAAPAPLALTLAFDTRDT